MDLGIEIRNRQSNPQELERLFRSVKEQNQVEAFAAALLACYEESPENQLFAAWFYRLQGAVEKPVRFGRDVNWLAAVPLGILTGLIFWSLSDFQNLLWVDELPYLLLWWSPIATMSALIFLAVTSRNNLVRMIAMGLGLLAATAFATLIVPALKQTWMVDQYIVLAVIHLPLASWVALGIAILGFKSGTIDRFTFLKKSIEVMVVAGLYLIAGVVFGAITIGLFEALNITLPDIWLRFIGAGGFGLLPVMAVATIYDPKRPPSQQDFGLGLSSFITTMMRLLLPLTLVVLAVYILVIPFNFLEPFNNRDLLIVYNLMLFGIMGLLLGATPFTKGELSPSLEKWLRIAIISTAILVVLVSVYALSAVVYRTIDGGLTFNRFAIIGWNIINIALLLLLIIRYFRQGPQLWIDSLQAVFATATTIYSIWIVILLVVLPLIALLF